MSRQQASAIVSVAILATIIWIAVAVSHAASQPVTSTTSCSQNPYAYSCTTTGSGY